MTWQDFVLTLVNITFGLALLPQLYHGWRTKTGPVTYYTSIATGLGLVIIGYTYFSLSLYLSALMAIIEAVLWFSLTFQRALYKKTPPLK